MTDVADPYERDENEVSIVPALNDVTDVDDADLDRDLPEDEDTDLYTRTASVPADRFDDPAQGDSTAGSGSAEDTVE